jgi:uncharacterized repeat protein (TIGR01451 family)
MYPGTVYTFTIAGTVGLVCGSTPVAGTGYAIASTDCAVTGVVSNGNWFELTPPALDYTVTQQMAPASPGIGEPVSYLIVITNTGGATINTMTVTDTVAPVIVNASTAEPSGFGPPTIVSIVGTGTLYTWTGAVLNFQPGASYSFTIAGSAGVVCAATSVSNTVLAVTATACGVFPRMPFVAGFTLTASVLNVVVSRTQVPASPQIGEPVTYRIVVENSGTATVTDLTVVDTVSPAVMVGYLDQPLGWAGPVVTDVGTGTEYDWSATGLTMYPGMVYTFTISGEVGLVCAPTAVSATAFVVAGTECTTTLLYTNAVGFSVQAPVLSVAVLREQVPTAPQIGEPVTYRIMVRNVGTATVTDLTVVDTVSPVIFVAGTEQEPMFPPATVTDVGTGTQYEWSANGLAMYPGAVYTFTIAGSVGLVCAPTAVSATAFVMAGTECTATLLFTNMTGFQVGAPLFSIAVTTRQTPVNPGVGEPISYLIAVRNAGTATLSDLVVTDTVSASMLVTVTEEDPTFGSPVVAEIAGTGTLYTWSASGLTMLPGAVYTFTISGSLGLVCASTQVGATAWAVTQGTCGTVEQAAVPSGFLLAPPVTGITVVKEQDPVAPVVYAPVTYRIVVTNAGTATVDALTVTDTVSPVIVGAATDQPVGWAAPVLTDTAEGTRYVWTSSGAMLPGSVYTFTVTGSAGWVLAGTTIGNTAWVEAEVACGAVRQATNPTGFSMPASVVLTSAIAASSTVVTAGVPFWVYQTVTNSGPGIATAVSATLWETTSLGTATTDGPSMAAVTLGSGASVIFTWTVTGVTAGPIVWTGTATSAGPVASGAVSSESVLVRTPAILAAYAAVYGNPRNVGQDFLVTLTVTNTGGTEASGISVPAPAFVQSGGGTAALVPPEPTIKAVMDRGESRTYTWTFTGSTSGVIVFTATVTGVDTLTFGPLTTGPVDAGSVIQTPAVLAAMSAQSATIVCTGQTFRTTLTVTNTGEATALNVLPTGLPDRHGIGTATPVAWPTVPVSLSGGMGTTFVWTYLAMTPGPVTYTMTATGTDANTGGAVTTAGETTGANDILVPGSLVAAVSAPSLASVGQNFEVILTVTNAGTATIYGVVPEVAVSPPAGLVVLAWGPSPTGPVDLAAGVIARFTWTYSVTGVGPAVFTATGYGADLCVMRSASASVPVTLQTAGSLGARLVLFPAPMHPALNFLATLTVTNTGSAAVSNIKAEQFIKEGIGGAIQVEGPYPNMPFTLAGGASITFTWTYSAGLPAGPVILSTTVTGIDVNSGFPLSTGLVGSTIFVNAPAVFASMGFIDRLQYSVGQVVTVTYTVTNPGGSDDAINVVVKAGLKTDAILAPLTAPALSMYTIPGGTNQTFTWTYTTFGAGLMEFSLTVTGTDAWSGAKLYSTSMVVGAVQRAAQLTAVMSVSATQLDTGGTVLVTVTAANAGDAAAFIAVPPVLNVTAAGVVGITGPSPAGPIVIPGGTSIVWSWTVSGVNQGGVAFNATVNGIDVNNGVALSVPVSAPVIWVDKAGLKVVSLVAAPAAVGLDERISVVLTVSNTGRLATFISPTAISVAGDGRVLLLSPPASTTLAIGGHGTGTFTWVYKSTRGGTVTFNAGATSPDVPVAPSIASNPVRITEAGATLADMQTYPNPFKPSRSVGGTAKFRRMPPFSTITLYTIVGETVAEIPGNANGFVEWDGKNGSGTNVTPAIYIYLAKSPDGKKKIGKIQVAP